MLFDESLKLIADLLNSIKKEDMKGVVEDLFTPAEIVEMSERIALLKQLNEGKTQRDIAGDLGISVTTVSRGSRVLKFGRGAVRKYL